MQVKTTKEFSVWLDKVSEPAKGIITFKIDAVTQGHFGNCKGVGGGVSEIRVDIGPGYRIYFSIQNKTLFLLLLGGDKRSQDKDIKKAKKILEDIKNEA